MPLQLQVAATKIHPRRPMDILGLQPFPCNVARHFRRHHVLELASYRGRG